MSHAACWSPHGPVVGAQSHPGDEYHVSKGASTMGPSRRVPFTTHASKQGASNPKSRPSPHLELNGALLGTAHAGRPIVPPVHRVGHRWAKRRIRGRRRCKLQPNPLPPPPQRMACSQSRTSSCAGPGPGWGCVLGGNHESRCPHRRASGGRVSCAICHLGVRYVVWVCRVLSESVSVPCAVWVCRVLSGRAVSCAAQRNRGYRRVDPTVGQVPSRQRRVDATTGFRTRPWSWATMWRRRPARTSPPGANGTLCLAPRVGPGLGWVWVFRREGARSRPHGPQGREGKGREGKGREGAGAGRCRHSGRRSGRSRVHQPRFRLGSESGVQLGFSDHHIGCVTEAGRVVERVQLGASVS
ncbi:hypothetical protein BV22DRAFT_103591 [Leucogyrophana mollusca]|uniref:Uncharacterized protein n=1 Tax=Leucogyrophana mollusca TaxID=85980 RepID=A0ACB8BWR0_9AGAM|nr:hypothetical protein BV22DRAFT_103591 [Leucogyrophana mollusca]